VVPDQLLRGLVGLRDRGEVGLRLDSEITRAKATRGDPVGCGGDLEREVEI